MPTNNKMAWSLDFGGCCANSLYYGMLEELQARQRADATSSKLIQLRNHQHEPIITANALILDKITREISRKSPQLVLILNASSCQSVGINRFNGGGSGPSVFRELVYITNALPGAILDVALLPDAFCNLECGETWKRIMQGDLQGSIPECPLEGNKILLLYFQMQQLAIKHLGEGDAIEFNFVDNDLKILKTLRLYFLNNPHMIPKGMKLVLHRYDGIHSEQLYTINGTGDIDYQYRKTLIAMTIEAKRPILSGWNLPLVEIPGITSFNRDKLREIILKLDILSCFKEPEAHQDFSHTEEPGIEELEHSQLRHSNFFRRMVIATSSSLSEDPSSRANSELYEDIDAPPPIFAAS